MSSLLEKFKPAYQHCPVVVVQGLGFVGAAMAAALSSAKSGDGAPLYRVIGVDLASEEGQRKIAAANSGVSPIRSSDPAMDQAYARALEQGNLIATDDVEAFGLSDIVVVDIPFDVKKSGDQYEARLEMFMGSIRVLAENINPEALVIVETTVPPGMTEGRLLPLFKDVFEKRGIDDQGFSLAHSYERVMPGANYLRSITDFYRVYAGVDEKASDRARAFLESFINTKDYPLQQLHKPAASEMAKVMENSYRALNIAFLQEWTEFAEGMDVDMFGILDAIRMRPTHKNIMSPGFGVGGYCLTKDALLADWACREVEPAGLPLSREGIRINDQMPLHTVKRLREALGGSLTGRKVAMLGVSYLNDVADTRYSPSEVFVRSCEAEGASVYSHDPLVAYWPEMKRAVATELEPAADIEAVVLTVRHKLYMDMPPSDLKAYFPQTRLVIDANNILNEAKAAQLRTAGVQVIGIGRGHWN